MAPEQAAGDLDRIDERTDVFALGALLYHVLTGAAPYRGKTVDALVEAARAAKLTPIATIDPAIPRELVAICDRATAREPGERHRNAHELAGALEVFAAQAVLGRPSRALAITIDVVSMATVIVALCGLLLTMSLASSLTQQGPGTIMTLVFGVLGCVASIVEWLTRGRYRLGAHGFALALVTFFLGVAQAASGLGLSLGALAKAPLGADDFLHVMADGMWESLGGLTLGAGLAAFQLMLWAVARRRAGGAIM
jgi:hypothetical protein